MKTTGADFRLKKLWEDSKQLLADEVEARELTTERYRCTQPKQIACWAVFETTSLVTSLEPWSWSMKPSSIIVTARSQASQHLRRLQRRLTQTTHNLRKTVPIVTHTMKRTTPSGSWWMYSCSDNEAFHLPGWASDLSLSSQSYWWSIKETWPSSLARLSIQLLTQEEFSFILSLKEKESS